MNKKAYLTPMTKRMDIKAEDQLLSISNNNDQIIIKYEDEEVTDGWADAKQHSVWDTEE